MLKHREDERFLDCFARARNDESGTIASSPPSLRATVPAEVYAGELQ
ncbi:MAG: hypothetical protein WCG04_06250 [Alphaproteobacteria bacterium]